VSTGAKKDESSIWARLGRWVSPCFGPFSLGGRFQTYEPSISVIFLFFSRGKPRILNQWIRGHDCTFLRKYSFELFAVLICYAAFFPTQLNLSAPSLKVMQFKKSGCP
jgi:hypothetical protein